MRGRAADGRGAARSLSTLHTKTMSLPTMTDDYSAQPGSTGGRSAPPTPAAIGVDGLELSLADHRLAVTSEGHTLLDVSITELRRIQFDIERGRPATLVIVPDRPSKEPQVVVVPPAQFAAAGEVLAYIGRRLDETDGSET
jgi:hypothetical protein